MNLKATPRPSATGLYRGEDITAALNTEPYPPTVYLVNDEHHADRLWNLGYPATGYPTAKQAAQLRGADIVVVLTKDNATRHAAVDVVKHLTGIAASIEVVDPAVGHNIGDHLDAGRHMAHLVTVAEPVPPTLLVPGCDDCEAAR